MATAPKPKAPPARRSPPADGMPLLKLTPPSDYAVIPVSRQTLMCGVGEAEGRKVLAPYVQLQLFRTPDLSPPEDGPTLEAAFEVSLSFENLAYLITDLAQDFGSTTRDLALVSSGALQYEPNRLTYAVEILGSAMVNLQATAELLTEVAAAAGAARDAEARQVESRIKPKAGAAAKGRGARRSR